MTKRQEVYSIATGQVVDSFSMPTAKQLKKGHPNLEQMTQMLNSRGYCLASQVQQMHAEYVRAQRAFTPKKSLLAMAKAFGDQRVK